MDRLSLKARGKINLTLDVLNKRPDGYHDLKMIMQTVELHDIVDIINEGDGIKVTCNNKLVPSDQSNIAYKAAKALGEYKGVNLNVTVSIEKNIPVAAGMAGGSSDAAAVLKGINKLFSFGLSLDELASIGRGIGADVPYCIYGGTMLAEGIGEILTPLPSFDAVNIVLVKPKIEVSTAWVFKNFVNNAKIIKPNTNMVINAIKDRDLRAVGNNLANVLESVTTYEYPVINDIKAELIKNGALGSLMSGSGPTVFGIFEDFRSAESAYKKFIEMGNLDCYLTKTICGEG